MSPARQPYRAPPEVCGFFERFRSAIDDALTPDLRKFHRCRRAEARGGGESEYKRHLHNSRFDDVLSGFIYLLWPNDMNKDRAVQTASMGLYIERAPFKVGAQHALLRELQREPIKTQIEVMGYDLGKEIAINNRDRTTGVWIAKKTFRISSWDAHGFARDCGRGLGRLMVIVHPIVQVMVRQRFPELLKL